MGEGKGMREGEGSKATSLEAVQSPTMQFPVVPMSSRIVL